MLSAGKDFDRLHFQITLNYIDSQKKITEVAIQRARDDASAPTPSFGASGGGSASSASSR